MVAKGTTCGQFDQILPTFYRYKSPQQDILKALPIKTQSNIGPENVFNAKHLILQRFDVI